MNRQIPTRGIWFLSPCLGIDILWPRLWPEMPTAIDISGCKIDDPPPDPIPNLGLTCPSGHKIEKIPSQMICNLLRREAWKQKYTIWLKSPSGRGLVRGGKWLKSRTAKSNEPLAWLKRGKRRCQVAQWTLPKESQIREHFWGVGQRPFFQRLTGHPITNNLLLSGWVKANEEFYLIFKITIP